MDYNKYIKPIGWLIFIIALVVYAFTAQQSVMFWDSGEFIASSFKVQATHPPGAPLYTLLSRVFLLFFPTQYVAFGASLFSALCGAITVWFLFHTLIWLGNKVMLKIDSGKVHASSAVIVSAIVGSLALTFSDTFWVSSTEAEVYTLSTVFMAASFWAITKWEQEKDSYASKWLLLIVFFLGLSMGVHVLNLAILFPLSTLIAIRKFGLSIKGIFIGLGTALLLFIGFNNILVQGVLKAIIGVEITAVNDWGWNQHSGTFLGIFLYIALLTAGILWARFKKKRTLELVIVGIVLFTTGWSSYTANVIRSDAKTPTSNHADDVVALLEYMRSTQYGFNDRPLFYGPTFMSVRDSKKEYLKADPIYAFNEDEQKYVIVDDGKKLAPNYMAGSKMLFPRMWGKNYPDVEGYKKWVNYEGKEAPITITLDGKRQNLVVPTMGDNLAFFFKYQLSWLNYRYFMWNFVGRQNDMKGVGTPNAGNWVSGIPLFDSYRIGSSDDIPDFYLNDKSKNEYYFLPLILGLIGIFFLFKKGKSELVVLLLFFLAFGVAVTIFINQLPIHIQIRERDYIFLGAYYSFCSFIGMGVLGLINAVPLKVKADRKSFIIGGLCLLLVPGLMGFTAWDDHDRSEDVAARRLAKNMLDQCDENAILITAGDNISFPLWYMQEVEGHRTDVRIIDYNLLGLSWYSNRLRRQTNDSPPLKIGLSPAFYKKNQTMVYPLKKNPKVNSNVEISKLLNFITSTQKDQFVPIDLFKISVDTNQASFKNIKPSIYNSSFTSEIKWQLNKNKYSIKDIAMFDILSQNKFERPVFFSNNSRGQELFMGLEDYFLNKGMVYQLLPLLANPNQEFNRLIDQAAMEELVKDKLVFDEYKDGNQFSSALNSNFVRIIYMPLFYNIALTHRINGDMEKCIEVLDIAQKTFPNESMVYDQYMFKLAALYYEAGDDKSWREVSNVVMKNLTDEFNWYTSFNPKHEIITYERVEKLLAVINSIKSDINRLDKPLSLELNPKMSQLDVQYRKWITNNSTLSELKNNERKKAVKLENPIVPNF